MSGSIPSKQADDLKNTANKKVTACEVATVSATTPLHPSKKYEIGQIKRQRIIEDYQDVLHRDVDVEGFLGTERAHESIQICRQSYKDKFPNGWPG